MYIHLYGDRTACKRHLCILQSNTLAQSNDRDPEENAPPPSLHRLPFRCILLTWSFMLSIRLNSLPHSSPSDPRHSHLIPGLCFASWRARSFLLEKPPPPETLPLRPFESPAAHASDCGQPSTRQKRCLECRLKCFRRSQPRVNKALEVQPGYAHRHVCKAPMPGCDTGTPYARRDGDDEEDSAFESAE
jgi:hypothetical protein